MSSGIYQRFLANLFNKIVDMEADTIKIALLDSSHAFNGAHNGWADVSANETSGNGYVAGGQELSGKSVTQAAATKFDATNITWSNATFSAYHAVGYDDSLPGKDLCFSIDFGGEQAIAEGNFTIEWSASGIITLSE